MFMSTPNRWRSDLSELKCGTPKTSTPKFDRRRSEPFRLRGQSGESKIKHHQDNPQTDNFKTPDMWVTFRRKPFLPKDDSMASSHTSIPECKELNFEDDIRKELEAVSAFRSCQQNRRLYEDFSGVTPFRDVLLTPSPPRRRLSSPSEKLVDRQKKRRSDGIVPRPHLRDSTYKIFSELEYQESTPRTSTPIKNNSSSDSSYCFWCNISDMCKHESRDEKSCPALRVRSAKHQSQTKIPILKKTQNTEPTTHKITQTISSHDNQTQTTHLNNKLVQTSFTSEEQLHRTLSPEQDFQTPDCDDIKSRMKSLRRRSLQIDQYCSKSKERLRWLRKHTTQMEVKTENLKDSFVKLQETCPQTDSMLFTKL